MGGSPVGTIFCCLHFLDLGVVDPWYNASYLHDHRSGGNQHGVSFPSWFQCPFGYLLNLGGTTGGIDGGLAGQLGIWDDPMHSLYAELEGLQRLEKGMAESSASCWSLSWGSSKGGLPNIISHW